MNYVTSQTLLCVQNQNALISSSLPLNYRFKYVLFFSATCLSPRHSRLLCFPFGLQGLWTHVVWVPDSVRHVVAIIGKATGIVSLERIQDCAHTQEHLKHSEKQYLSGVGRRSISESEQIGTDFSLILFIRTAAQGELIRGPLGSTGGLYNFAEPLNSRHRRCSVRGFCSQTG